MKQKLELQGNIIEPQASFTESIWNFTFSYLSMKIRFLMIRCVLNGFSLGLWLCFCDHH